MHIESNRDWHRLIGDHDEKCVFMDRETMTVSARDDQMAVMIEDWNTRATLSPAHIEDGEEVEVVATVCCSKDGDWYIDALHPSRVGEQGYLVEGDELMTVAQHQRIVAALSAPPAAGTTSDQYRAELYDEVWQKARDLGYGNVTDALVELERIKAAPPAAGVPEGWKLIPAQPNEAMLNQISPISGKEERLPYWWYQALIKSAPTPPASEQQQTVQQPHTVEFVGKTCQRVLMAEGKPYPRTCAVCGLSGPCKSFPRENDR